MREIRSSRSVEGVVSNHDPYSDFRSFQVYLVAVFLPDQLQPELQLPGSCGRLIDLTGSTNWIPGSIEQRAVSDRRSQIHSVQYVEDFESELNVEGFRNLRNLGVLRDRKIKVRQSRTYEGVTTCISQSIDGIWSGKTLCLDVVVGVARIHGRPAARTGNAIGERIGVLTRTVHAQGISRNKGREWQSSACLIDSAELPATERPESSTGKR